MALLRDTKARAKRIDLAYFKRPHPFRRWKRVLSLLAPAAAAAWIAAAAARGDDRLYTSGPLASRHAMLETQCGACHDSPWAERLVDPETWQARLDAACLKCHDGPAHHLNATHQVAGPKGLETARQCSRCHLEHEGSRTLADVADRHCVACHGDLRTLGPAPHPTSCPVGEGHAIDRRIRSFPAGHPDFALFARKVEDRTPLQFNHAAHLRPDTPPRIQQFQEQLRPLTGAPGVETAPDGALRLDCIYCHRPAGAGAYMASVSYEAHCRACHAPKFEGTPVPHERPALVRDFLRSRLAGEGKSADDLAAEVAGAESGIYTADADNCAKCHRVKEPDDPLAAPPAIAPTNLRTGPRPESEASLRPGEAPGPRRWFVHSVFNHDTHRTLRCLECHPGGETSKLTSDVLMSGKATCAACHSAAGGVTSGCVTCHLYHGKSRIRSAAGRLGIGDVLK